MRISTFNRSCERKQSHIYPSRSLKKVAISFDHDPILFSTANPADEVFGRHRHEGNWHWNVSTLVNAPIGPWSNSSISNLSFNHWGLDTTAAVTWLNPKIGFEVSAAPGFTFNWTNPDTDYKTGTEFHVEFALLQHFSKKFAAGVAGFHYQ